MDSLIVYGILAVVVFYLCIAAGAVVVMYGAYLLFMAVITGTITSVVDPALVIGIFALTYGCIGLVLAQLRVI
ncbi:MAG: hypothetical protein NTY71_05770 [Methanoregula sp.]|nr:hypothetical protein [Methanoregula sp.]